MANRFQPLIATTSKVRSVSSSSEKCGRTALHTSSGTWVSLTSVLRSADVATPLSPTGCTPTKKKRDVAFHAL